MPACIKCGLEVEAPATVCAACAPAPAPPDVAPTPPPVSETELAAVEPPPPTAGQRAQAGAKKGALLGAIYGGAYGIIMYLVIAAFTDGVEEHLLFKMVVTHALLVAAPLAAIGGVLGYLIPPKKKKRPPAEPTDAKP